MKTEVAVQEETSLERVKVVGFLLMFAAIFLAEVLLLFYCILKTPELTGFIYDKVTLPSGLLFMIPFKGVFQFVMFLLSCVPGAVLMGLSWLGMVKLVGKNK